MLTAFNSMSKKSNKSQAWNFSLLTWKNLLWGKRWRRKRCWDMKKKRKCRGNQLSQEIEQNDFTFLFLCEGCHAGFESAPSVKQTIAVGKQPQCWRVLWANSRRLYALRLRCLRLNAKRLNVRVCLLYALDGSSHWPSNTQFFGSLNVLMLVVKITNSWPDNIYSLFSGKVSAANTAFGLPLKIFVSFASTYRASSPHIFLI